MCSLPFCDDIHSAISSGTSRTVASLGEEVLSQFTLVCAGACSDTKRCLGVDRMQVIRTRESERERETERYERVLCEREF